MSEKAKDLIGKRFGRLTIISRSTDRYWGKHPIIYYNCLCDCGNKKEVRACHLRSGNNKSCGCFRDEKLSQRRKIEPGLTAKHAVFISYKNDAKKRNLSLDLSFEQFLELSKKNCFYCDSAPLNTYKDKGNGGFIYQGIDRIDSTKGYFLDNVVSCCKICNLMKGSLSSEEFITHINKIHKNTVQT